MSSHLQRTALDRGLERARTGLFGLGYIMVKDVPMETRTFLLIMVLDFLQISAFPLNSSERFPWRGTPVYAISSLLNYITTDELDETHSMTAFKAVLAIAATWVGLFVLMSLHVAKNFLEEAPQQASELKALRGVALLSTTTLFLPLTSVLFRGLACPGGEVWMESGWSCDSAARVGIGIFLAILLVGFAGLSLFVAAVFINRDPASRSWSARSHGRVDVILLLQKLFLSFVFNVLSETLVGHWVLTVILVAGGVLWFYLMVTQMPLTHEWINSLQAGFALGYTWLCLCLALQQGIGGVDLWLLVFVTTPFVIAVGFFIARSRAKYVVEQPLGDCRTVHEANAWARSRMQSYRKLDQGGDQPHRGISSQAGLAASNSNPAAPTATSIPQAIVSNVSAAAGQVMRRIASFQSEQVMDAGTVISSNSAANRRRQRRRSQQGQHPEPDPNAFLPLEDPAQNLKKQLKNEAQQGYAYLMSAFSNKELAFMIAASFYEHHSPWNFQEATALARSIRRSPSLDTRFQIYRRSRQMRESDGSGLSPIDRIIFDQKMREVAQMRISAFRTIQGVWATLSGAKPDLQALSRRAHDLDSTLHKIEATFRSLLRINSDSVGVLRGYASFLTDIRNDTAQAQELLNRASRIEEQTTRSTARAVKHVDFGISESGHRHFDDDAAVITVSAFETNLGEILKVSPAATRLFAYPSKSFLVGQNLNILLPTPIKEHHNRLMRHFGTSSSSPTVNKSRLFAGIRRDGVLIPTWLNVTEAPPDEETCEPRFQAYFSEVVSTEDMIFFGGEDDDFAMYGCTQGILRLLGLSGEMVQSEQPSMLNWFPTLSKTYDPQEVRLEESQVEWLKRGVSQGEVTGSLSQQVGSMERDVAARGGLASIRLRRIGTRKRSDLSILAQPLLDLESQGIIPVTDTTTEDADSIGSGPAAQKDSSEDEAPDLDVDGPLHQDLLFGQVKPFRHPMMPTFYVLTCRLIPKPEDAQAAIAAPSPTIARSIESRSRRNSRDSRSSNFSADAPLHRKSLLPAPTKKDQKLNTVGEEDDDDLDLDFNSDSENSPGDAHDSDKADDGEDEEISAGPTIKSRNFDTESQSLPVEEKEAAKGAAIFSGWDRTAKDSDADSSVSEQESFARGLKLIDSDRRSVKESDARSEDGILSATTKKKYKPSSESKIMLGGALSDPDVHLGRGSGSPKKHRFETANDNSSRVHFASSANNELRERRFSGGMSASSAGTAKTGLSTQLRRTLDNLHATVEPEVRRVRLVLLSLNLAVLIMAIVVHVWISGTWEQVRDGAQSMRVAGVRSGAIARGVGAALRLSAWNAGVGERALGHNGDTFVQTLRQSAKLAEDAQDELYVLGETGGIHAATYEVNHRFVVYDPVSRETTDETIVSLTEKVSSTLARLSLRAENVSVRNPDVRTLLYNVEALRPQLEHSFLIRHEDALTDFEGAQLELAVGGLLFLVLCVVLTSLFLVSALRSLRKRTRRTLLLYLFLPLRLAKSLRSKSNFMLQQVMAETENGDEDAAEGADDEVRRQAAFIEEERSNEAVEKAMEALRVRASAIDVDQSENDEDGNTKSLEVMTDDDASHHRKEETAILRGNLRPFQDTSSVFQPRVFILLSPVVFVLVLLATIFTWQTFGAQEITRSANRVVVLQRAARNLAELGADFTGFIYHPNSTRREHFAVEIDPAIEGLVQTAETALYGGEIEAEKSTATVERVNDPNNRVFQVLATDACVAIAARRPSLYQDCVSFDEEILTHGSIAGIKSVIAEVNIVRRAVKSNDYLADNSSEEHYPPYLKDSVADVFSKAQLAISPFLHVALDFCAEEEDNGIFEASVAVEQGNIIVTWCFTILIFVSSFSYFWRQAAAIADPLRAAQALLTLMPSDAIATIPPLGREIRRFVSHAQMTSQNKKSWCGPSSKVGPED